MVLLLRLCTTSDGPLDWKADKYLIIGGHEHLPIPDQTKDYITLPSLVQIVFND